MQKLKLIRTLQTVFPTFQHLLKEARQKGDYEIVDLWTYQTLRSRGFKLEVVEEQ